MALTPKVFAFNAKTKTYEMMGLDSLMAETNYTAFTLIVENVNLVDPANKIIVNTGDIEGRYLNLTKVDFVLTQVQPVGTAPIGVPIVNMGFTAPSFNEIADQYALDELTQIRQFLPSIVNGPTLGIPPKKDLVLKVQQVAVATKYTVAVRMLGYYF